MTPDDPAAHGRERSNTREALDMQAEEIRQRVEARMTEQNKPVSADDAALGGCLVGAFFASAFWFVVDITIWWWLA